MASSAIRGVRVGSGPVRPDDHTEPVPRRAVTYFCANGHMTEPYFAVGAPAPRTWDCPHCGQPAGTDAANPPGRAHPQPYKTHLAYVKERRSDEEGAELLAEALRLLRQRRGEE